LEIIRGVERRRRWDLEEKLRIVAETEAPGAVFAAVARRHDVSRGQLWNWRRLVRSGAIGAPFAARTAFLPIQVAPGPGSANDGGKDTVADSTDRDAALVPPQADPRVPGRIEIMLANGASLRIEGSVDVGMLKAAIAAARG
jgi:transposase